MIAATLCIVLGGVTFENVEIPDLYVSPPDPITGITFGEFLHADIDRDGFNDLILADRVYLCTNGLLDSNRFISMPDVPTKSAADVWGNELYVLAPSYLAILEYREDAWRETLRVQHDWRTDNGIKAEAEEGDAGIFLLPMLRDIDGDGQPEILRVDQSGISVAAIRGNELRIATLDLFPSPSLQMARTRPVLWPQSERRLSLPNRRVRMDVVIDGRSVRVLEHESSSFAFEITQFEIIGGGEESFGLNLLRSHQTMSFPSYVVPYTLGDRHDVGFVGYDVTWPTMKNWKPQVQTFVSTDGGLTVQRAASRGFKPRTVVVDLDGDGDQDWLVEESGLVMGGLRDAANRALFQRAFSHKILARMQKDDGTFDDDWHELAKIEIELDRPARHYTYRCWQYLQGDLIDCTGDYNGDGWRDLSVAREPELVSIYLGGPDGFAEAPESEFAVPVHVVPAAVDVDGDGLHDIVGRTRSSSWEVSVYLNRGDTP